MARRLLITLVVLLVILVGADRGGVLIAEQVAGNSIQTSQHLKSRPDVAIGGFPFLNQLATGRYGEITITARDVPVDAKVHLLNLSEVRLVLHDLTVSRDFAKFHARTATAVARVSYAELSSTLGVEVSYAGHGRIRASKTITLLGASVTLSISSKPEVAQSSLAFADTAIDNAGQAGDAASAALGSAFNFAISFVGMPFDITVKSLKADAGGIHLGLAGQNLYYAS